MTSNEQRGLYLTNLWSTLTARERALIGYAVSTDADDRSNAWTSLLAEGGCASIAMALDLLLADTISARMGKRGAEDRDMVRQAIMRVLNAPAMEGTDRFGGSVPAASHVVALRCLAVVPDEEDARVLVAQAPVPEAPNELIRSWLLAATEVLRKMSAPDAHPLLQLACRFARHPRLADPIRAEAVLAVDAGHSPEAIDMLHDLVTTATGDARVEALAALAERAALWPTEVRAIRSLLANPPQSPTMRLRAGVLAAALASDPPA
ncbi:hypothetical protein [Rhodopila sp.]|uniref:hypothetical protein n=1 Tax=Rhodopila sp. TaxID=2480087 RepID=UPI002CFCE419|nr:hypothetical protein [Rhodopila sp.]HVZ08887.1 hypothetical protein [Rhodopila sp.]